MNVISIVNISVTKGKDMNHTGEIRTGYSHQWPIGEFESHNTIGHWLRFKSRRLVASYPLSTAVSQQLESTWPGRQKNTAVIKDHRGHDKLVKVKHVFNLRHGDKPLSNNTRATPGIRRCYVTTNMSMSLLNILWKENGKAWHGKYPCLAFDAGL